MASAGHSRQNRNSSSPSVIALSSTKAVSAATAKPRFRSRTGCWTCRRRKVKCDERGRNPETVAYGGPLSTSAGCKRCEDSGRPCHGYGAQAPSAPLVAHYPSSTLSSGDSVIGTSSVYSFPSASNQSPGLSPAFQGFMPRMDRTAVPHSVQWCRPFEQSPHSNQNGTNGHRMSRPIPSSSAQVASTATPISSSQHASMMLPTVDLRRYSAPNYPTWQSASQPRGMEHFSHEAPLRNAFDITNNPSRFGLESGVYSPSIDASATKNHTSAIEIHSADRNLLQSEAFQSFRPDDSPSSYNHAHSERANQSLSFDYTRPHTSNGVTLPDINQSYQNATKAYRSTTGCPSGAMGGIREAPYTTSTSPARTAAGCEVDNAVWSEPHIRIGQTSATSLPFRSVSSMVRYSMNSLDNSMLSSVKCEPLDPASETFKNVVTTEHPKLTPTHEVPYPPRVAPTEEESSRSQGETSYSLDTHRPSATSQPFDPDRTFNIINITPHENDEYANIMSNNPTNILNLNADPYVSSYVQKPPANVLQKSPDRKNSSSSSASSLSTYEHCASPIIPMVGRSQSRSSDKWDSHGLNTSLENHQYDFNPIRSASECKAVEMFEDDSPISTSHSNLSGATCGTDGCAKFEEMVSS